MIANNLRLNISDEDIGKNLKIINLINDDLQTILNNNPPPPFEYTENDEIELLLHKLNFSQIAEYEIQKGISYLQRREIDLKNIKILLNKLKSISKSYSKKGINNHKKEHLENIAARLIKNINKTATDLKSNENNKADGKIVTSNYIGLVLDAFKKENSSFSSEIDTLYILSNLSIIEETLIKPIDEAITNVLEKKSYFYNKFLYEYLVTAGYISKLTQLGGISEGMKDILFLTQNNLISASLGLPLNLEI